jgi:hypothetical protein
VGAVLPIDVLVSPFKESSPPTDVMVSVDDDSIAEVVRVTQRRLYATNETPEQQVPLVEVRAKAIGETVVRVSARHLGQAVSAEYRFIVGTPDSSRLSPWCIERDSGSNLDNRAALAGELIWFNVEATSPSENPNNPHFYYGLRSDAIVVEPSNAATFVPDDNYVGHYGLRVEASATEFTVQSSPNPQTAAADYKVVAESEIVEIKIAGGPTIFGLARGATGFLSWSSMTEDRFLCGQAEEASVSVSTPEICDVRLVVGEAAVRDAMSAGIFNFWRTWHPQKAIRVEGKAVGDCVVELDMPKVNGGQGLKTPITIPITADN